MGIPKFFRWISERYPLTSQLIQENKIPEFDNFYLDFNSIIHNCSHPNDDDAHFRLSEEQIFAAIFQYVDHLFGKIKPKKLFFMAVDGVAPRAKMNQQRGRRFRTAKEARELREKAERRGETLPAEKAFDSNCITPGTPFMVRLSAQLRYFVNKKITEDADWRDIEVVLSGHEVPGEGEHKIMEYIRLSKAQPDYNPNVRHCLYGLDADLIMLGLLSHDPHFCLLREEVKFGPAKKKTNGGLESQNFFLLHLSLLREYLDLEFSSLSNPQSSTSSSIQLSLPFEYSLERIIDDFILLAIFVGNDFLPHLPDLHIHEHGLERLFDIYKNVLPKAGGYLVKQGVIDLKRLQLVLDELAQGEIETFERDNADINYLRSKQSNHQTQTSKHKKQTANGLVLTLSQKSLLEKVKRFVLAPRSTSTEPPVLAMLNNLPAGDREFLKKLATELNLFLAWDEFDNQGRNLVTLALPRPDEGDADDESDGDWEDVDATESLAAIKRVLKKYDKAPVLEDTGTFEDRERERLMERMDDWKRGYYMEKLEFGHDYHEATRGLVYRYIEGLQWVLHYYYSGVASWGWFYNYHYAPKISDLKGVDKMTFSFDLGEPFKPFEQLMGVLPEASKDLIPRAYQDLMYNSESPILDFYPQAFEQDLNGKKQEWEAVVKIPFIEKERLQSALRAREHKLTSEERQRNSIGTSTLFTYNPTQEFFFTSSLPGFFPDIPRCKCAMTTFDLPMLDGLHLVEGLCDGVFLGTDALAGFPSLKTLQYTAMIGYHQVNVFQSESRNQSMVISIRNIWENLKTADIARLLVGERMFMNWPFLQEGMVAAVSDDLFRYEKNHSTPHPPQQLQTWKRKANRIEDTYSKKCGVLTGEVEVLLHIRPLKGLRRLDTGAFVKEYEDSTKETEQALQMGVTTIVSEDPRYLEKDAPDLAVEFPVGTKVIFLGDKAYGTAAQVLSTTETSLTITLAFFPAERTEANDLGAIVRSGASLGEHYYPAYTVANMLNISGMALAKITSSLMVTTSDGSKSNLGLSLKFEAKSLKVMHYSRKDGKTWEFSEKALQLIQEYKANFPDFFATLDRQRNSDLSRASDFFPSGNGEARVKDMKKWLKLKGVRDLEPVSLFCDQLNTGTIKALEAYTDALTANRTADSIKKAVVQNIPRQAVLKPSHAIYRLQNQVFGLGDRVIMVQESGSIPLCAKGVVIGLNAQTIDILWDQPIMAGTTLGNRCSQYRGSTLPFNACLNITQWQFLVSENQQEQLRPAAVQRRPGQYPALQPSPGHQPAGGFRPQSGAPMHILVNPSRNVPARHHDAAAGGTNQNNMGQTQHPSASVGPASGMGESQTNLRPGQPANARGTHPQAGAPAARGQNARGGRKPAAREPAGLASQENSDSYLTPSISPGPAHVPPPARGRGGRGSRGRGGFRGRGADLGGHRQPVIQS